MLIVSPLSIETFLRSSKYRRKSKRVKPYCTTMQSVPRPAFAVTNRVKFEDSLEEANDMVPFESSMLMKVIEVSDPKARSFSKEYNKVWPAVPGTRTCTKAEKSNCQKTPLT
jgi:hypothetical protein